MMDVMNLVEEVNDVFYKQVVAQERKGRLCLTDGRISKYADFEELEDIAKLENVLTLMEVII